MLNKVDESRLIWTIIDFVEFSKDNFKQETTVWKYNTLTFNR